jgi:tetratricopeptide (TPR) repeat protein
MNPTSFRFAGRGLAGIFIATTLIVSRANAAQVLGGVELAPDPIVAEHLGRDAVLDLGLRKAPTPADYQLAATLLSVASDLDPTNVVLARSVVEAAWSGGDLDLMIRATRRIIKDDPRDTVALLRLVSSVINKQQTVEGRLRLYDRFLGDDGASLDVSVRSRLALDAALLERERGNVEGFVERLYLATKLDVSNKAAASLAAQYYSSVTNDPVVILDYQFKLLLADPLDANVHLTIARVLAREGAYESAQRFLNNAGLLFKLETGRSPSIIEEIRISLNWQVDGPESVIDELNPILDDRRAEAQSLIDSYIEAQLPTDDLRQPANIRYELGVDKLRLLASYNLNDPEGTQKILDDIEATINDEVSAIGNMMSQRGVDTRALLTHVVSKIVDFQVLRAIVGLGTDKIRTDIDEIVAQVPVFEPYFSSIEPMALYAEGQYAQALALASEQPPSPPIELIRGLSNEKLGHTQEAIDIYLVILRAHPLDAFGAFARSRIVGLGEGEKTLSIAGRQMIQIVNTIPGWIDQMILRPSTFMYLEIIQPKNPIEPLVNPMVTIRLKNLAPIPLALGPSQPLDSTFLIVPRIDDKSRGFRGKARSRVVEMNTRLRLRPLEEVNITVPIDSDQTAWLMSMQPNISIYQRWRLLQGFRPRKSDELLSLMNPGTDAAIYGIVHSPLGLTSETNLIQRRMLPETLLSVEQLIEQFASDDQDDRRRAVLASAGRLLLPATDEELSLEEQTVLIGGLMDLYTRAKASERAQIVLQLPQRHQVPEMIAFDDHVVGSIVSDALIDSRVDSVLLISAFLTRVDAPDSPLFEVLDQAKDPRVLRVAQIIKARLEADVLTLGTIGPGVESMIPPKESFGP